MTLHFLREEDKQTEANTAESQAPRDTAREVFEKVDEAIEKGLEPVFFVGETAKAAGRFLEREWVPSVKEEHPEKTYILFSPKGDAGLLSSLSEALQAMIPGLTAQLLGSIEAKQWTVLLQTLLRNEPHSPGHRVLVIDQFDELFDCPVGEQLLFAQVIGQLCREKSVAVVIGVSTEMLSRSRQLPGLSYGPELHISSRAWVPAQHIVLQRAASKANELVDGAQGKIVDLTAAMADVGPRRMAIGLGVAAAVMVPFLIALALYIGDQAGRDSSKVTAREARPQPVRASQVNTKPVRLNAPASQAPEPEEVEKEAARKFETIEVTVTDATERVRRESVPPAELVPVKRESAEAPMPQ